MNPLEFTAAEHQEIGELLPWFVNGRLSEVDRQRVDAHLRLCEACSEELVAQSRIYREMSADAGVERMPMAGLNRLRLRIENLDGGGAAYAASGDASGDAAGDASGSISTPASDRRQRRSLIAASVAMTAVGALGAVLWNQNERGIAPADYRTVTTAVAQPANTAIRAVFAPTVTLSELQELLDDAHLKIVSGPTEAGVYSLATSASPSVDWSLRRLRAHEVVRFAESVVPSSVTGQAP